MWAIQQSSILIISFTFSDMINSKIHKQIVILLCQCILQSRIDVDKNQIRNFNTFISKIKNSKERTFKRSTQILLNNLILKERNEPRQKSMFTSPPYKVSISFDLKPINQQNKICIQSWFLTLWPKHHNTENCYQTFLATALVFEELLFFLTNQPLFTKYIRDTKMKQQYQICYNLVTNQNSSQQVQTEQQQLNLVHYPCLYSKERTCKSYKLFLSSYSLKSFQGLHLTNIRPIATPHKQRKNSGDIKLKLRHSAEDKFMGTENTEDFIDLQLANRGRKLSLYEVYDDGLQCILVSSSQNSFCSSPNSSIKQISFFSKQFGSAEDEFEMLEVSPDEKFLSDNQSLFKQMSEFEIKKSRLFN